MALYGGCMECSTMWNGYSSCHFIIVILLYGLANVVKENHVAIPGRRIHFVKLLSPF